MRINSKDETLKRNYIQKYQFLIKEYESIKAGTHPTLKSVGDFYALHGTCRQTFSKYYRRFQDSNDISSFLPGKRGPRFRTRRTPYEIEQQVLSWREKGCNKYEIHDILKTQLKEKTPASSTIYQILKRYGKNKINPPMQQAKRTFIKEKIGELGHIDTSHLSKDTIANDPQRYYLIGVIDSCSRLAWVEICQDVKALSVMFATLRCFNHLANAYDVRFVEVLTDNGPEFGPRTSQTKESHPFERLLTEMGIKHRYTKPYRPQTNGKIERFWRTLNHDLIEGTYFSSIAEFNKELTDYLVYYNQLRPHQSLNGLTPTKFSHSCHRIT
ncbi:MAG: hypothetical protein CMM87_01265 [Rickettsiales bacterium]|nr:hypothetical protein [Rickettsiales bacterium]|tara:strand:+ start:75598 stop:76578 length:981 start_codon:yes stop_codon:yes gene_type:complete